MKRKKKKQKRKGEKGNEVLEQPKVREKESEGGRMYGGEAGRQTGKAGGKGHDHSCYSIETLQRNFLRSRATLHSALFILNK